MLLKRNGHNWITLEPDTLKMLEKMKNEDSMIKTNLEVKKRSNLYGSRIEENEKEDRMEWERFEEIILSEVV